MESFASRPRKSDLSPRGLEGLELKGVLRSVRRARVPFACLDSRASGAYLPAQRSAKLHGVLGGAARVLAPAELKPRLEVGAGGELHAQP